MNNCYRCKTCGTINVENNPSYTLNKLDKEILGLVKKYPGIRYSYRNLKTTYKESVKKLFKLKLIKRKKLQKSEYFLADSDEYQYYVADYNEKEYLKKEAEIEAKKIAKAKERLGKGRIVLDSETDKYINVDKITLDFAIKYNRNYRSTTIKKIGADKYFIEDIDGEHSFESGKQIIKELKQYLLFKRNVECR